MPNHPNRGQRARAIRAAVEAGRRGNSPAFDPLNPTPEEQVDMVAGYQDGASGRPPREDGSLAYAHGRRNGTNDRAHTCDDEQLALAARIRREREAGGGV